MAHYGYLNTDTFLDQAVQQLNELTRHTHTDTMEGTITVEGMEFFSLDLRHCAAALLAVI